MEYEERRRLGIGGDERDEELLPPARRDGDGSPDGVVAGASVSIDTPSQRARQAMGSFANASREVLPRGGAGAGGGRFSGSASTDSVALDVQFSPTSAKYFRQHSFTALGSGSTTRDVPRPPRCRSLTELSLAAAASAGDGNAGSATHTPPPISPRSLGGAQALTARSPQPHMIFSPTSGLYVPVTGPQKNYELSPVHPPFMPSLRNYSFFDNIIPSSSSSDGDGGESPEVSICSQCAHRPDGVFTGARAAGRVETPSHRGLGSPSAATAGARRGHRHRSSARRRHDERPADESIVIAGGVTPSSDRDRARSPAASSTGRGRRCCVHREVPCGKYCRQHRAASADWSKERRGSEFERRADSMLATARTHAFNLLAAGRDETQPLFRFEEIAEWQKYNYLILTGYRSYYTTKMTLRSLFSWHNESINIWSHLTGFIAFLVLTILLFTTTLSSIVTARSMSHSRLVYAFFCFGCMLCMLNSAMYHLFTCHRKLMIFTLMGRLDFLGITTLIVASFIPPLYVQFHCQPNFRAFYTSVICVLGIAGIVGPWTKVFHENLWLRTGIFIGMALSGVVPSLHALYMLPYKYTYETIFTSQIYGIVLMFVLYGAGVFFYTSHFPESAFPGKFDTVLSSHQIWHFFVLMAAMVHYCNTVCMYQVWQISDGAC